MTPEVAAGCRQSASATVADLRLRLREGGLEVLGSQATGELQGQPLEQEVESEEVWSEAIRKTAISNE